MLCSGAGGAGQTPALSLSSRAPLRGLLLPAPLLQLPCQALWWDCLASREPRGLAALACRKRQACAVFLGRLLPWASVQRPALPPGTSFLSESVGRATMRSLGVARRAVLGACAQGPAAYGRSWLRSRHPGTRCHWLDYQSRVCCSRWALVWALPCPPHGSQEVGSLGLAGAGA